MDDRGPGLAARLAVVTDVRTSPRVCLLSSHIAAPTRRTSRVVLPITCATAWARRQVFLDAGSIPAGADFRHTIQEALRRRGVLIAIVGPEWMAARHGAPERINDPDDPVRMEIATALDDGLPIIPVLVNGASMPAASELPDDVKDFAYRNALTIDRGRHFHRDADELVRDDRNAGPASGRRRPSRRRWWRPRRRSSSAGSPCRSSARGMACGAWWRRRRPATSKWQRSARRRAGRSSTSSARRSSAISSTCSATPSCACARR